MNKVIKQVFANNASWVDIFSTLLNPTDNDVYDFSYDEIVTICNELNTTPHPPENLIKTLLSIAKVDGKVKINAKSFINYLYISPCFKLRNMELVIDSQSGKINIFNKKISIICGESSYSYFIRLDENNKLLGKIKGTISFKSSSDSYLINNFVDKFVD